MIIVMRKQLGDVYVFHAVEKSFLYVPDSWGEVLIQAFPDMASFRAMYSSTPKFIDGKAYWSETMEHQTQ